MSECIPTTKRSKYTLGEVVRQFGQAYVERYKPSYRRMKILNNIGNCRTAALGGRMVECSQCNYEQYMFNSCGNGNCPQCQNIKKELWIDKMSHHLLPVKHFHVIFTIPHELNDLVFYNQKSMYQLKRQLLIKMLGIDPDFCPNCGQYQTMYSKAINPDDKFYFRLKAYWHNVHIKLRQQDPNIAA